MQETSLIPAEFGSYPGPVMRFGPDGRPEAWNSQGGAILASVPDEIIAQILDATHKDGAATTARVSVGDDAETRHFELTCLPQPDGSALAMGRDITFDANVAAALSDSRQRYKDLADLAGDFAWETQSDGNFCFISTAGILGHDTDALIGTDPVDLLVNPASAPSPLPFRTTRPVRDAEMWVSAADGTPRCLAVSAVPVAGVGTGTTAAFAGARGICRDVTAERRQQAHLAMRSQVIGYVIDAVRNEAAPQAMLESASRALGNALSADGCIIHIDDAPAGYREGACFGSRPGDDVVEIVLQSLPSGSEPIDIDTGGYRAIAIRTRFRAYDNGAISAWRYTHEPPWDTEDRALLRAVEAQIGIALHQIRGQQALETLSRTDPLTMLLNRRAFSTDLNSALKRCIRNGTPGALVYVDLDNFKAVNDSAGHEAGDLVLVEVSDLLRHMSRGYDLLARLGGDEFALWLDDTDEAAAETRARELLQASTTLRRHSPREDAPLGFSIGAAVYSPEEDEQADSLMRRADQAMYEVKHGGKHGFAICPPAGKDMS